VKWSCEPARAEDVPGAIARAYHVAMQPPAGPTFVSIPEDDWDVPCEPVEGRDVRSAFRADPRGIEAVAAALAASARPAVVVGPAVDRDGAWDHVIELVERCGAAVWVSPLSSRCSFPEDHAAFAGFLVPERRKLAAQLAQHDVVVVIGAPVFTYHVHADGPFVAPGTSSARAGSQLHFTYGLGSWLASSENRNGSSGSIARVCWPAVMTSGARLRIAVKMLPRAWPTPTALCRLTNAALPVAWA
jgi:hypothetical protein